MKNNRSVSTFGILFVLYSLIAAMPGLASTDTQEAPRPFKPADVHRLHDVSDLAISPDGAWVAYAVRSTDLDEDERSSDLYMVRSDGSESLRLTFTEDTDENHPRFSPDGRWLAFLAARGGDEKSKEPEHKTQVWLLDRRGGEAQRLTALPGGVSGFEWSPDGKKLALVGRDPDPQELPPEPGSNTDDAETTKKPETRNPIVVDRYRFKQDGLGYLVDRYQRIYLFDMEKRASTLLTPGDFDSTQPNFSPDGSRIAFTSSRPTADQPDPDRVENSDIFVIDAREGAEARRLTTFFGNDSSPVWSPDGASIAYIRGPEERLSFYGVSEVAILPAEGESTPLLPTRDLDRSVANLRWSADGTTLHFAFEDDRERLIGSVPADGGPVERRKVEIDGEPRGVVDAFEIGPRGVVALASFPHRPAELYRLANGRALTDHNRELRESIRWAEARGLDVEAPDGTRIGSVLWFPPDFEEGRRYPTIAHIHGGPTAQDAFQFDWMAQAMAGAGFLVVQPNYRGSSGRGEEFSRTLYQRWADGVQDIHAVVDALVEQGLADPDRLGIGGWSYGGINTNYAIASDTRWKAAVSGSGIANLLTGYGTDQYIWQYENEIGKPWIEEDLERYIELSFPFYEADRIETPTLFMCGENDFNVPLINSEQMYQALRSLGVPTQLVIYPGQFHGLSVPSYLEDRAERMIAWFSEYLGT